MDVEKIVLKIHRKLLCNGRTRVLQRKVMIGLAKLLRELTELNSPSGYDLVLYVKLTDWIRVQKGHKAKR